MAKFSKKNRRSAGKMVGQTFNPGWRSVYREPMATMWLSLDDPTKTWIPIRETLPLGEAIKRYPRAKAFKDMSVACHDVTHYMQQA